MIVARIVFFILACILFTLQTPIYAQPGYDEKRGELLYSIHCASCHDSEIHWREKKLVTDWHTLKEQVNRWEINMNLDWNNDDTADVAAYLNAIYYHFPVMLENNISENGQSLTNTVR